jgi:hypothetical protein
MQLTMFKVKIESIRDFKIGCTLFVADKKNDAYVNTNAKGLSGQIVLSHAEFADFCMRLIAYTYCEHKDYTNRELKILWEMKLNIFDSIHPSISKSIFLNNKEQVSKFIKHKANTEVIS